MRMCCKRWLRRSTESSLEPSELPREPSGAGVAEVIDDTMLEDQFGEDSGNIYKPESTTTGR
ncbi:MAG TPA: hypothetical protein EYQ27_06900 [Gemmatimonadetes bacterium]|nr:hypothetical protein [Gemmatimonadota bacterium]